MSPWRIGEDGAAEMMGCSTFDGILRTQSSVNTRQRSPAHRSDLPGRTSITHGHSDKLARMSRGYVNSCRARLDASDRRVKKEADFIILHSFFDLSTRLDIAFSLE